MISTEEKLEVTNNQFRTAREKIIMTPINKVSRNIKKYDISELYNSIAVSAILEPLMMKVKINLLIL